jgi:hypothetical protein
MRGLELGVPAARWLRGLALGAPAALWLRRGVQA